MKARPQIPLIDVGGDGRLRLLELERARAERLVHAVRGQFSGPLIDGLDVITRRWARKGITPFLSELEQAAALDLPGGLWFLNLCLEWGCTTGAVADEEGIVLRRTLDWAFNDVGRDVVVVHHEGPAGIYYDVTWPGFFGVVTAMAPGRFSLAINQAPIPQRSCAGLPLPWPVAWALARHRTLRGSGLPPSHLVRQVLETCTSFEMAVANLCDAPLALPVIFTVAGTGPGEAVVIERDETDAELHTDPAVVANAWLSAARRGHPRGAENPRRRAMMRAHCEEATPRFDWVEAPILNRFTRLAVVANAATGQLLVRGYEKTGVATEDFDLAHNTDAGRWL